VTRRKLAGSAQQLGVIPTSSSLSRVIAHKGPAHPGRGGGRHWHQTVSRKLAEFLVSKYCPTLYVSRMRPFRRDRVPGLSFFAHWYSRNFQLGRLLCLPERNFAVFSLFSLSSSLSLSLTRPCLSRARAQALFVVHKLYSPRDHRSFFCSGVRGSRRV